MPDQAPEAEARAFAVSFRSFLDWIHQGDRESGERNPVAALTADFLGPEAAAHSVVSRDLPAFEHVNLQTAIDAWSARDGRAVDVQGVLVPQHYSLNLQEIVSAESLPPIRLTAPALVDLPDGPDSTLGCLKLALLLVTDARGRYILMVQSPGEHHPGLEIEVAGLPVGQAQAVLGELDQLRSRLNVYRGHVLDATLDPYGRVILTFLPPPRLTRDEVVL